MKRILVVDDNADNRYSMRLLLEGYEVLEADGGQAALDLAAARRPDCILLDVQMPGLDGFEVCRRLRARAPTRSVPIILVTAHHRDTESLVRGLAAGGDDYITKPVAQQELLARVRAMLRIRDLQDQLEVLNGRLEEEVKERTRALRQIYRTVPVGIYTLDATGHVMSFNHHLETMLGHAEEDVVGKGIGELYAGDYDALYWLDLCRREGRAAAEGVARHKEGGKVPVYDERVATFDEVGEHVGFTGYLQDLRERHRTRTLVTEQETQAGVGRLAAGIVHEIANPVSGVAQYLDAVLRRLERGEPIPPAELRHGASVMRDALERTNELLRRLRGFTQRALRPVARVEVCRLVEDLHALMRHDLHRRGVEMEVRCGGEAGCTVEGDAGRLSQVFLNLVTNARDAMPEGGRLTVEVRADDSTLEVDVTDTGVGIPEADQDRVFEFLYTTKGEEGTGFGLTISRDIVAEHGGTVALQSAPGKGSTFTVRLPRRASGPAVAGRQRT